jgi:hypothetical protein
MWYGLLWHAIHVGCAHGLLQEDENASLVAAQAAAAAEIEALRAALAAAQAELQQGQVQGEQMHRAGAPGQPLCTGVDSSQQNTALAAALFAEGGESPSSGTSSPNIAASLALAGTAWITDRHGPLAPSPLLPRTLTCLDASLWETADDGTGNPLPFEVGHPTIPVQLPSTEAPTHHVQQPASCQGADTSPAAKSTSPAGAPNAGSSRMSIAQPGEGSQPHSVAVTATPCSAAHGELRTTT